MLNRRVVAFTRLLDDALKPPSPPLEERRPDQLAAHYRELRRRLLLKWDAPLVNDFFAMIFYGLLRGLVRKWCGDPNGTLQNDLVGGTGGMVSAEPAIRMHRLARLAASDDALRDRLLTASLPEITRALESAPQFRTEYAAYLDKFGERTVNELKLESATLHDDPLPLLRAVGNLAGQMSSAGDSAAPSDNADSAGDFAGHAGRVGPGARSVVADAPRDGASRVSGNLAMQTKSASGSAAPFDSAHSASDFGGRVPPGPRGGVGVEADVLAGVAGVRRTHGDGGRVGHFLSGGG